MAAASKEALLKVHHSEFEKLELLLDQIDEDLALEKDADNTSIKDVVGHRQHWIRLFLGWHRDGLAGREVFFPAPGYKWSELPRYNAVIRDTQTALTWKEARSGLRAAYEDLTTLITESSETDLYGGPMKGAKNNWTSGRWAESAGPSHFRSASKYIRVRLRNRQVAQR